MKKIIIKISLFLSIVGCSGSNDNPPQDESTDADRLEIQNILTEAEDILLSLGVKENLFRIPVIVSDNFNSNAEGACYKKNGGTIVLKKNLMGRNPTSFTQKGKLWFVLMHEVGHCYFNRKHESLFIKPNEGYVFNLYIERKSDSSFCHSNMFPFISASVMNVKGIYIPSELTQELKLFFLSELIKVNDKPILSDLEILTNIEHIEIASSYSKFAPCSINYPPRMPTADEFMR